MIHPNISYSAEFLKLVRIAVPLVVAQLAQTTISFVDTLMVGQLGKEALAGIAIGSTFFFLLYVVFSGVILGVSPMVSQAVGAHDLETVDRATRQGLWLSVFLFVPGFLLFWFSHPILLWLGQLPETARDSSAYLKAVSWGLLPGLGTMALRGLLEGHGNSRPIMLIAIIGVGLNVVLNQTFMFGGFGIPAMGLVGTGYASSLVYLSLFLMLSFYIQLRYPQYRIFANFFGFDRQMLWKLTLIGLPIGMTLGFECSMFSAAAFAMGLLGKDQLAAHQIALQTASVSFMVPLGLAIATSVRVGQAIGRQNPRDAETAGHIGMLVCMGVMVISAAVFLMFPLWIIGLYTDIEKPENVKVIEYATSFLTIAALFQIFDGLQVSGACSLRGLKDTTASMLLTLPSYWLVGSVFGYLFCFRLGWGGAGLWLGMTLGLATAAVLLSARFQWKVRQISKKMNSNASFSDGP